MTLILPVRQVAKYVAQYNSLAKADPSRALVYFNRSEVTTV
jgi:hypothetical protein